MRATVLVDGTGERFWQVELHRLKRQTHLAVSTEYQSEAETCFRQAIDVPPARREVARAARGDEPSAPQLH